MGDQPMNPSMRAKKMLRPLIPDRWMARYRLAQHSRQVRTNVDVVLADQQSVKRWLGTTPDTYRVVDPPPEHTSGTQRDVVAFGVDEWRAVELLSLPGIDVGVVARVAPPTIVGRRRVEPSMEPTAIASTASVVAEVGGLPDGPRPLPGLLARLRDAGRRIAVLPIDTDRVDATRHDPIERVPVVILAAVPLHDIGGGSRASQFAFALLRSGFHVTYVAMHGTQESFDLGLRYIHPDLEQCRADQFESALLTERAAQAGFVLVEAPFGSYREPVELLAAQGWSVVYDIIDDWSDPALGGGWYEAQIEQWLIERSSAVTASAQDLVERAEASGVSATLIPNAVNRDVFGPTSTEHPADLPRVDGPLFGYHGSLYGDWFDWEALGAVAEAYPGGAVVVIGDTKGITQDMPPNVVFLGLKAQSDLPRYVQQFDVGLLPFRVTPTTHAVSPLKVYEYLASGVPVAASPLRPLEGLTGVYTDPDLVAAVATALAAPDPDRVAALESHSWEARVAALLEAAGLRRPPQSGHPVVVRTRPSDHYGAGDRDARDMPVG